MKPVCPQCRQPIAPRLMDCMPSSYGDHDYRCPHCEAWLTTDLRTRLILMLTVMLELAPLALIGALLAHHLHLAKSHGPALVLLLVAVLVVGLVLYGALLVIRRVGTWRLSPSWERQQHSS